jgi:hypothetical protein
MNSKENDMVWQERRLEEILYSDQTGSDKLNQIIDLGYGREVARELMQQHEVGMQTPVYYETLADEPMDREDD